MPARPSRASCPCCDCAQRRRPAIIVGPKAAGWTLSNNRWWAPGHSPGSGGARRKRRFIEVFVGSPGKGGRLTAAAQAGGFDALPPVRSGLPRGMRRLERKACSTHTETTHTIGLAPFAEGV